MKVTQCKGDGQGSCKRCSDKGKWNRTWMCFLYKIEGYEGCYCSNCVKELQAPIEKRGATDTNVGHKRKGGGASDE